MCVAESVELTTHSIHCRQPAVIEFPMYCCGAAGALIQIWYSGMLDSNSRVLASILRRQYQKQSSHHISLACELPRFLGPPSNPRVNWSITLQELANLLDDCERRLEHVHEFFGNEQNSREAGSLFNNKQFCQQ